MSARPVQPSTLATTIALRFVADLQAGRRPSIEAALDSAPSNEWSGLLQSLLTAEVNYRRSHGESPNSREYLPRFPTHMAIVRTVFPDASQVIPTAILVRAVPIAVPAVSKAAPAVFSPLPASGSGAGAEGLLAALTTAPTPVPIESQPIPTASMVPSPAIPVARAYLPPTSPQPMPIVEPIDFENFEPQADPAPARQRRRKRRLKIAGAAIAVLLMAGITLAILKIPRSKGRQEGTPEKEAPAVVAKGTIPGKIDLFGAKAPATADPDRELAEWVLSRGGYGTAVKEVGGQVPFSAGTPLPKVRFFVTGIVLPSESTSQWKAADLERLRDKEKLVNVQLHHPTDLTDASLEPLAALPLQSLELHGANVGVTGTFLSKFPELTVLTLLQAPAFTDADLAIVAKLTKLTSFSVNSPKFTTTGLKDLKNPSLRSLHFGDAVKFSADHVRVLQGLPIEEFSCDSEIGDDAFLEFAVMPNIRRFRLRNAPITDGGMIAVVGLGKLEELRAVGANVGVAGLEHLIERTGLKILDLSGSKLDNDSLGKLLALPALKELRLVGSPLGDPQVNLLAQLDGIEILDLSGTNVTDAALTILKKHPTLKSLVLTGTKVSATGVSDFESATPNCKVTIGKRP